VQIGDNRAAEWVRRSNPVALGLLFSGLAGQLLTVWVIKLAAWKVGNTGFAVLL
jgi:hypothetical protein